MDTTFENNTINSGSGGIVYFEDNGVVESITSTVIFNTMHEDGCIRMNSGNVILRDNYFTQNQAKTGNGAVLSIIQNGLCCCCCWGKNAHTTIKYRNS